MKNKKLQEHLSKLPDNANVVISRYKVLDEEHNAVEDTPIFGLVENKSDNEIRLFIETDIPIVKEVETSDILFESHFDKKYNEIVKQRGE